jgi:hypothetical protein
MADNPAHNSVLYTAVYADLEDAKFDLGAFEQLHKDHMIGKFDAADVVGLPPVRSREILEALVTASPFDDAAVCRRPYDHPGDQRLTGERAEPVPDRRLERVVELVACGPPLDVE